MGFFNCRDQREKLIIEAKSKINFTIIDSRIKHKNKWEEYSTGSWSRTYCINIIKITVPKKDLNDIIEKLKLNKEIYSISGDFGTICITEKPHNSTNKWGGMWTASGEYVEPEDVPVYYERVRKNLPITPASMYEDGLTLLIKGDEEKAIEMFQKSAKLGHCGARRGLAKIYLQKETHLTEAVSLFQTAAQQGDRDAQYHLALCYKNGIGIEVDEACARMWFSAAAVRGDNRAKSELENMEKKDSRSSLTL